MTGMGEDNRKITDEIDAVGNTTKAVTKGFAIASAALAALAMIQAFQFEATHYFSEMVIDYGLSNPAVIVGLLVGGLNEETGEIDLDDDSLTENTRGAYPLTFIPNSSKTGITKIPSNIILLTCDSFGILPPIAKLSASQTMYHFLSGYTARVAGTEKGVDEPEATFSSCYGAPFMPRHPIVYGKLLKKLIAKYNVNCWLVNTGWTGGPYGEGKRMPIGATRNLLSAALDGTLLKEDMIKDKFFGFEVPLNVEGVDKKILNPRETWKDKQNYDVQAFKLVKMFSENFELFKEHVDMEIIDAAPNLQAAE